jgi:hypothetical protein
MKLLVIDNSQYVEFARCLGRSGLFDEVGYYAEWRTDFPCAQEAAVGNGFDEIVREYNLYDCLEEYDAFAFPDLYWADMQDWLRKQGTPVWGCGADEMLERDRWHLLQEMQRVGMKVPESALVSVVKAFKTAEPGDIVKISTFRGDVETITITGDPSWYHELALRWGPMVDEIKVIYQKPLPSGCEAGFDLLVVGGKPVFPFSVGYEYKDAGYIEKNINLAALPKPLKSTYDGVLKLISSDYNNFLSTEVLSKCMIDVTCRMPQPPGDMKLYLWQSLPTIIRMMLEGKSVANVETNPRKLWGCQLIVHNNEPSKYKNFGTIDESIRDHVYFSRGFALHGEVWIVPWRSSHVDFVDAVSIVGGGNSPEEAIEEAKAVAGELEIPHGCYLDSGAPDELMRCLEEGEEEGIIL